MLPCKVALELLWLEPFFWLGWRAPHSRSARKTGPTASRQLIPRWRSQYVVTGTVELRQNRYVLLDDDGVLEAYLLPRKSLQLDRYVGEYVELTVREPILANNGEPKLWVDRVAVPGQETDRSPVRQAAYSEDVSEGGEVPLPRSSRFNFGAAGGLTDSEGVRASAFFPADVG